MRLVSLPQALLEPAALALETHLRAAVKGHAVAVHQARVASRRLREVLPVVVEIARIRRSRAALDRVRRVTRTLGPVRELDVTLELLDELSRDERLVPAVRVVRRLVVAERARRRVAMSKALDVDAIVRAHGAVRKVLVRLSRAEDTGTWRTIMISRAIARAATLHDQIDDVGLLFDPSRLHQVRIAAKKLRYALELVGEARLFPTGRMVHSLKLSQEQLGRLHDLQVLLTFARVPALATVTRLRAPLALLRDHVERSCHREHARYLRRRSHLLVLCATVPRLLRSRQLTT